MTAANPFKRGDRVAIDVSCESCGRVFRERGGRVLGTGVGDVTVDLDAPPCKHRSRRLAAHHSVMTLVVPVSAVDLLAELV